VCKYTTKSAVTIFRKRALAAGRLFAFFRCDFPGERLARYVYYYNIVLYLTTGNCRLRSRLPRLFPFASKRYGEYCFHFENLDFPKTKYIKTHVFAVYRDENSSRPALINTNVTQNVVTQYRFGNNLICALSLVVVVVVFVQIIINTGQYPIT